MTVALISDTHIPERESELPPAFRDRIAGADHVIHAGDFETEAVLADISELATNLTAVFGNADPYNIDLPAVNAVSVQQVTFVVTHGMTNHVQAAVNTHGNVLSHEDWVAAIADTARARTGSREAEPNLLGVGGHSHDVVDEMYDGVRVLNPGTATGAAPADEATMMTVDVDGTNVDVSLHEV